MVVGTGIDVIFYEHIGGVFGKCAVLASFIDDGGLTESTIGTLDVGGFGEKGANGIRNNIASGKKSHKTTDG